MTHSSMYNAFAEKLTPKFTEMQSRLADSPMRPVFGGAFERLGNKGSPRSMGGDGAAPMTPQNGAPYTKLADPARQQLLQSMLMRARGGQAGGAPTVPLPAPNSNVPTV